MLNEDATIFFQGLAYAKSKLKDRRCTATALRFQTKRFWNWDTIIVSKNNFRLTKKQLLQAICIGEPRAVTQLVFFYLKS